MIAGNDLNHAADVKKKKVVFIKKRSGEDVAVKKISA